MKIKILLTVLASALLFSNCKKGADGKNGKDGSANVTSTVFSSPSWTDNGTYWYTKLVVPEITNDNINTSAVMVYFSTSSNTWQGMPCTAEASTNHFWNFIVSPGLVEVKWEYNGIGSGSGPNSFYGTTVQLRIVVIPPAFVKPGVNYKDYNQVKKEFNLPN